MAKEIKSEATSVLSKHKKDIKEKEGKMSFVFNKEKYIIMLVGLGIIFLGLLLMIGGGTDNPNEFSYELFSFRRLTLSPILILIGFLIQIYAIMKKPRHSSDTETKSE